jgi:hypothetical protein
LEKFFNKNIKLLPQRLYCVLGILSELLTILYLCLKKSPQLLVVIFKLFALQGLSENVLAVAKGPLVAVLVLSLESGSRSV